MSRGSRRLVQHALTCFLVAISLALATRSALAVTVLTETFEDPFPSWEHGWLGTYSNTRNYYVDQGGPNTKRAHNPDGLWLSDGDGVLSHDPSVEILFNPEFGARLSSLSMDVAAYQPLRLLIYDLSNEILLDKAIDLTFGATSDPGIYSRYAVTSSNGISMFRFVPMFAGSVEGNTSIDNLLVTVSNDPGPLRTADVPEPSTLTMGLLGLVLVRGWIWRRGGLRKTR